MLVSYYITIDNVGNLNCICHLAINFNHTNILNKHEDNLTTTIDKKQYLNQKVMTLGEAIFLLKNKYIINNKKKDHVTKLALLVLSNGRKEKSIKRIIYKQYLSIRRSIDFFINVSTFTKLIKDSNILVKLLDINISVRSADDFVSFIEFLKQYNYTEKQILNILSSDILCDKLYLWDIIDEVLYIKQHNIQSFKKVSSNVTAIYNEVIKHTIIHRHKLIFKLNLTYDNYQITKCTNIDNYNIKLPSTGKELYDWAKIIQHYLFSYFETINSKNTTIYGFFKNNILEFAVRVSNTTIFQASSKNNSALSVDQQNILDLWYLKHFNSQPEIDACKRKMRIYKWASNFKIN